MSHPLHISISSQPATRRWIDFHGFCQSQSTWHHQIVHLLPVQAVPSWSETTNFILLILLNLNKLLKILQKNSWNKNNSLTNRFQRVLTANVKVVKCMQTLHKQTNVEHNLLPALNAWIDAHYYSYQSLKVDSIYTQIIYIRLRNRLFSAYTRWNRIVCIKWDVQVQYVRTNEHVRCNSSYSEARECDRTDQARTMQLL